MKKKSVSVVNVVLLVVLVALVAVSAYFTFSVPTKAPVVEQPLNKIEADFLGADCTECFNLSVAFDFLKKQQGIELVAVRNNTIAESAVLAAKYNITHLPALILTGEVENRTIQGFERIDDALVFAQSPPPYYDLSSGTVKGLVSVIELTAQCETCFNTSLLVGQLRLAGVFLQEVKTIDASSDKGKTLVAKYNIQKVPTLIFNQDALLYDVVAQAWPTIGSNESDGALVLRLVNPPYVNVSTGKEEGRVSMTYLADSSCAGCLNVSLYRELFEKGFGMQFSDVNTIDVSSAKGKLLVSKYSIELVPTAILSNDASLYPAIGQVWSQAGTQEKDGAFVFRLVPLMQEIVQGPIVYRNLTANTTVNTSQVSLDEPDIALPTEEDS